MKNTNTYYTVEIAADMRDTLRWGTYGWQADNLVENDCIFATLEDAERAADRARQSILDRPPAGYGEIEIVENDIDE